MIRRPPRSTRKESSAASDVYKRQAFNEETLKLTDAYLSMYHDQGLPVLKALSFGDAVNITLGTPIIRTSVDHGTALELAGTNNVSTKSLVVALKQADQML